jgi:hypothetical protein
MRKPLRIHKTWLIALAISVIALGTLISVWVFATGDSRLTATAYSDVIRFQAEGVATLQVRIFDLSGKEVWGSGVVSGWTVDWDRKNDFGERLAYGAYIYSAQGWNAQGDLNFQKNGKLALMPGDQVQLQAAPVGPSLSGQEDASPFQEPSLAPMAVNVDHSTESWAFGQVGIGTPSPGAVLHVVGDIIIDGTNRVIMKPGVASSIERLDYLGGGVNKGVQFHMMPNGTATNTKMAMSNQSSQMTFSSLFFEATTDTAYISPQDVGSPTSSITTLSFGFGRFVSQTWDKILIRGSSTKVGLGTTSPSANLDIVGSQSNLLRLADSASPANAVFRVEKDGDVYADGTYYCVDGAFHVGSADVAERINTSEWVEAGNVVEIDPEHPGFFRKASSPYSTKVAGIISTSPGVILGNSFDEATDDWEDSRPVLAIAGRVPLLVTTENGPIQIGDLLVSSSTPGAAMRGDPEDCVGAVVGKAMEPLKEGEGTIVVQVVLR